MIYNNVEDLIGKTPIIKINTVNNNTIYLKLEWFNPGGSIKDRIAYNMLYQAEKEGLLQKGDTIIEPTSGNTGIGLAMLAAAKGYKIILTMPESLSIERRKILKAYGAELILTPASQGIKGAVEIANKLQKEHNYFMPMQFKNLNNPKIHMCTTYHEIIEDVPSIDFFVAGVGTGGTITGVGTMLKTEYNKNIKVIAVEPSNSAVLSGKEKGPHKIQGIGAGFIPDVMDIKIIDDIITIDDDNALNTARLLAKNYGLLVGISTGANVAAALEIAQKVEGKHIVTVSPDGGERYLSTELYDMN
jgi:cysteine synthase A